jgi:hypothetical protein
MIGKKVGLSPTPIGKSGIVSHAGYRYNLP